MNFLKNNKGFTLVEMAIVLVILGFVLAALLLPLQAQRNQLFQTQTENTLEIAKKALLGYAQSKGRLPCPAIAASNGMEDPLGGGTCTQQAGFLPAATLGITPVDANGFAIDGWNNRIHYAITTANANAFVTSNGMSNFGIVGLAPDLRVCATSNPASSCTPAINLINNAVAVIFSTGKNFGQSAGVDETSNLSAPATTFYSRTPTAATAAPSYEFDDMVIWISPFVLYNAMVEAGQLH